MLRLTSLLGNSQKLDGGAMFGNVPRTVWSNWLTPDNDNRISLNCRCLLVQENDTNILLETGIGAFFEPALKHRYGVIEMTHQLLTSLAEINLTDEDIHFIVLSHLHFDHAGGLLRAWKKGDSNKLLFPNAQFIVSEEAWERANDPHPRDRASFIPDLNQLLRQSGRLKLLASTEQLLLGKNFRFHLSHGHTPGMLLTEIVMPGGPIVFAADLIPGIPWVHLPITMGYDRYPELLINEKQKLLEYLAQHNGRIFYTHDPDTALSNIQINNKKQYQANHCLPSLNDLHD